MIWPVKNIKLLISKDHLRYFLHKEEESSKRFWFEYTTNLSILFNYWTPEAFSNAILIISEQHTFTTNESQLELDAVKEAKEFDENETSYESSDFFLRVVTFCSLFNYSLFDFKSKFHVSRFTTSMQAASKGHHRS